MYAFDWLSCDKLSYSEKIPLLWQIILMPATYMLFWWNYVNILFIEKKTNIVNLVAIA